MGRRWTRKLIIQEILSREAKGLPMSTTGEHPIDNAFYQASVRIFGSWRNALMAAGISPVHTRPRDRWTQDGILNAIRQLARRKRPLTVTQINQKYGSLVVASRRIYGSWTRAVLAAGVDPRKVLRTRTWTRDRVIEAILTRALNNEPLGSQNTRPRSLVEAGRRFFGKWAAAKEAAGVSSDKEFCNDPPAGSPPPLSKDSHKANKHTVNKGKDLRSNHQAGERWTDTELRRAILRRFHSGMRMNASAVSDDNKALYSAAVRRYGIWDKALYAMGLDPQSYRCRNPYRRRRSKSNEREVKAEVPQINETASGGRSP